MEKPEKIAIEFKYEGLSYRVAYYEGQGAHFWKWDVEKNGRGHLQGRECWRKVDIEDVPQRVIYAMPAFWVSKVKS